jgi:hypothetical protein
MRGSVGQFIAVGGGCLVILALAYLLYRPRIQRSTRYQATVVPLANIMHVGFRASLVPLLARRRDEH